jgi:uncharacterized membrane protein YcfT
MQSSSATVSSNDNRVAFVDYAKGICIILVVTMHSTLGTGEAMGGEGFMHQLVAFAKPFRMPDFFLIAGLFASHSLARDWRIFLDRKVLHFAYFYVLWAFIQCATKSVGAPEGAATHFLSEFSFAMIEPFGTLWFIYLLPIFFVTTRILHNVNPLGVLLFAAALETLQVDTGWTIIDEFSRRFVYFYSGYLFAGPVFELAGGVVRHKALAIAALCLWAAADALAVHTPARWVASANFASMPLASLCFGYAGAIAIVAISALLADAKRPAALGRLGSRSIVVYLAFFLPMAATRALIVKTGLVSDIGVASLIVTIVSVVAPLLIARMAQGTAMRFLFERPDFLKLGAQNPLRGRRADSRANQPVARTGDQMPTTSVPQARQT